MNLTQPYALAKDAAIRSERFGALVYRHDNRRLYFIHSQDAAAFVATLDGKRPLDQHLASYVADNGLPESAGDTFVSTVAQLERLGIVAAVPAA